MDNFVAQLNRSLHLAKYRIIKLGISCSYLHTYSDDIELEECCKAMVSYN